MSVHVARDKNGNPYPVCEEHATEFRVTYPTRTVESVAKLGLEPYHFGLGKTKVRPGQNARSLPGKGEGDSASLSTTANLYSG